MKKRRTKTAGELAKQYNCHVRTIRAWRHQKAPLHDPKAMRQWLSTRKNLPPRLPTQTVACESEASEAIERTGAPAALDRLARAEVAGFNRLQRAQTAKEPDPVLIRAYRQDWLKTLEALRHYEKCVTADRRALGELVERAEIEKHLALLGQALRQTAEGALPRLACELLSCDQIRARQLIRRCNWHCYLFSLGAGYASELPPWLLNAYAADLKGALTHGETLHSEAQKIAAVFNEAGLQAALIAIRDTPPVPPDPDKPKPPLVATTASAAAESVPDPGALPSVDNATPHP